MNVFVILGILFLALVIAVPLIERFGKKRDPEELSKLSRWIMPLVFLVLIAQLIKMAFF